MNNTIEKGKAPGWLSSLTTIACAALLGVAAQATAQSPDGTQAIVVEQSPSLVTFVGGTTKSSTGRLKVRIAGPAGRTVFETMSRAGVIDWAIDPALPDGKYRWDAWFVPQGTQEDKRDAELNSKTAARYRSGQFRVRDGSIVASPDTATRPRDSAASGNPVENLLGRFVAALVPSAKAAGSHNDSVVILDNEDDGYTDIAFDSDSETGAFRTRWHVANNQERLDFLTFSEGSKMTLTKSPHLGIGTTNPAVPLHIADTVPRLRFEDTDGFGDSGPTAWTISASSDEFRLQDNDGGGRPLVIDAGGDSGGAPTNSLFISADGNIGLGTSTPETDLHVVGTSASLTMEGTASGRKWAQFVGGGDGPFLLQDRNSGLIPFIVRAGAPTSSLDIDSNGNVGMGTFDIDSALHVERSDGTAQVLVRESSVTSTARELFKLSNNGGPFFIFENRDLSESYSFAMGATGHFLISHQQTSGVQFRLRPDGSAEFQGDVKANGVLLTSSREAKTDFAPIDETEVLDRVAELDVSQWRYKREPESARHVGPMAEDFRDVFGLGDGRHISAGDANGILFAAAKALREQNRNLAGKLAARDRRVLELESRLEALESRVLSGN